jgi:NTP pyrophosphatase (non-canonical NTP hydrolase)
MNSQLASAVNLLVDTCHGASKTAGWWTNLATGEPIDPRANNIVPTKLCLVHSEISEAMEGDRKNLMDDKLPHRSAIEVELADAVIRIGDLAGALGLDLGGAIAEKMAYNAQRADHKPENRVAAGGKTY